MCSRLKAPAVNLIWRLSSAAPISDQEQMKGSARISATDLRNLNFLGLVRRFLRRKSLTAIRAGETAPAIVLVLGRRPQKRTRFGRILQGELHNVSVHISISPAAV